MAGTALIDLLQDDLAVELPVESWEHRLQMIWMPVHPVEVSQFYLAWLQQTFTDARQNLHDWTGQLAECGEALPDFQRLDAALVESVLALAERARGSGFSSPERSRLASGMKACVEQICGEINEEQNELQRSLKYQQDSMLPESGRRLALAVRCLQDGLAELGSERQEQLREAKNGFHEVAADEAGENATGAILGYATTLWKLTRNVKETIRVIRRATARMVGDLDIVEWWLLRFVGNLEALDDNEDEAWNVLSRALTEHFDPELAVELAAVAMRGRRYDQARQMLESAAATSPMAAIYALSDARFAPISSSVLALAIKSQKSGQQAASQAVGQWNSTLHKIKQAQKRLGIEVHLPADPHDFRREIGKSAMESGLPACLAYTEYMQAATHEAMEMAKFFVEEEHGKRLEALKKTQAGMDGAWTERDAMIAAATRAQDEEVHRAREALRATLKESERTQSGCVLGLGAGCGTFVLYLILAAVLTMQGINAGFGSMLGMFGIAASFTPIILAISAQLAYGAHRAALDAALHEKMQVARRSYELASKQADKVYRERLGELRDVLHEAETAVQRSEEALRILLGNPATS